MTIAAIIGLTIIAAIVAAILSHMFATPLSGLTATCKVVINTTATEDTGITQDQSLTDAVKISETTSFTFGSTSGKIDLSCHVQDTLAASGSTTHDLRSMTDAFGNTITFSKIKAIFIRHRGTAGDSSGLNVGAAASDVFAAFLGSDTDILKVASGGVFFLRDEATGYTVDATNKDLKIEHDGVGTESVTYDLWLAGLST